MRSPLFVFPQWYPTTSSGTRREVFIYPRFVPDTERRHGAEIGPTLNRETRARAWSKMMNFEFKCPQCGQMVEADEAYRGQVAECPHCGKGIVVPRGKPKVQVGRKKSLVNVQGQSHSTVGSNSAFHKLVTDPPREVSNKWVWCLAIIPLVTVWTLSILVDSFVGYLAGFTLIIIFVILDFKEIKRSRQDESKTVVLLAFVFLPGYLFYRAGKVPAIICCALCVLPPIVGMLLPSVVKQQSVQESVERRSEDVEFCVMKNSAGEYDWQSMCQKEWPKSFVEIQKAFSAFGGFQLTQRPSTEVDEWGGWMEQKNVPLQKPYRYFEKADLKFFYGALVEFKLKVHFSAKYSKASIDREYEALKDDVVENLKHLNNPDLRIELVGEDGNIPEVRFGPSVHKIIGQISTECALRESDDGYDCILSICPSHAYVADSIFSDKIKVIANQITFIKLVIEKEAYEAGEELEKIDRKAEETETRSTRTETSVPSPMFSVPEGKETPTNRPEEVIDSQSQPEVRQVAECKAENAETRSTRTETTNPSLTTSTPNEKESSPNLPDESTDPQPQTVARPNPHFEAAQKHDWQRLCQKEWSKSFLEIQEAFSEFGGFRLAQPPIEGIEFDTKDVQKDVSLQKQYRYFKKADLEFFNGALVGFSLKAHFANTYSKASVERECKAFQDDVVKNLNRLKRPALGIGLGSTFPSHPWHVEYGQPRSPSVHKMIGTIIVSYDLSHDDDGYDLTLFVDAQRGMRQFIKLALEKEADETGVELEDFDKKQQAKGKKPHGDESSQSPVEHTSKTVKITGFGSYKFGQKYPATRMTAEMRQERGLAIKPVQTRYRKFKTLELGYAIDGKQLCHIKLCAEFPPNANDNQLRDELMEVKSDLERQLGFEMAENGDEATYEDENYIVRLWHQSTTKTVYNTRHVGFRKQRVASALSIKGLYLLLESKRLMPK